LFKEFVSFFSEHKIPSSLQRARHLSPALSHVTLCTSVFILSCPPPALLSDPHPGYFPSKILYALFLVPLCAAEQRAEP